MKCVLVAMSIALICWPRPSDAEVTAVDFESHFDGFSGCFILLDLESGRVLTTYNPTQCAQRLPPCSTFKVPSSLVALESGVIEDQHAIISWDGTPQPFSSWERDHDLASAIHHSVVWYYQELASRVGEERMQHFLDAIDYGNHDISDGITQFWLTGSLRISADEQAWLLKRLYDDSLPVDQRAMGIVKDILVLEQNDEYVLSGKTGTCLEEGSLRLGWFIGHVQTQSGQYVFATNIKADDGARGSVAKTISLGLVHELLSVGVLD